MRGSYRLSQKPKKGRIRKQFIGTHPTTSQGGRLGDDQPSIYFDGTGKYYRTAPFVDLDFRNDDFTIEFWFQPNSNNRNSGLIDTRAYGSSGGSPTNWGFVIWMTNTGQLLLTQQSTRISGPTLSNLTWYHIALTKSNTDWKLYVNGSQVGSTYTQTTAPTISDYLVIGNFGDTLPSGVSTTATNGWMEDIRISNYVRYTGNFTAPTSSRLANDENTVLMISGNWTGVGAVTNNIYDNNSIMRTPKSIWATYTPTWQTTTYKFNGSNITAPGTNNSRKIRCQYHSDFNFGTGAYTIEGWFYRTGDSNQDNSGNRIAELFSSYNVTGTKNGIAVAMAANSTTTGTGLYVSIFVNGTDVGPGYVAYTFNTNTWYHIAISRSGSTTRYFVNGTQIYSVTNSANLNFTNPLFLGSSAQSADGDSHAFVGYMEELRISNSARYTAGFTAPTAPFVNDSNTVLLARFNGNLIDDCGVRAAKTLGVSANFTSTAATALFGTYHSVGYQSSTSSKWPIYNASDDFKFGTADFTIEGWFYPTSSPAYQIWFDTRVIGGATGIVWWINNGTFTVQWGSTTLMTSTRPSANTWTHIAFVRQNGNIKLYFNGAQVGSTYTTSINMTTQISVPAIGNNTDTAPSGSFGFVGYIDEFRVSNSPRYIGSSFTVPTEPFINDVNTLMLFHMSGTTISAWDDNN